MSGINNVTLPVPVIIGTTGAQQQSPISILSQVLAIAAQISPGYTGNLPGSLIDDISGTDVAAILLCNSFFVDLVNSVSPLTANPYLLTQLGQVYGVPQGLETNTSVFVTFSGPPGFLISNGFIVSDGTNQYITQEPIVIAGSGSSGTSLPVFCVATQPGAWAVPAGSVQFLITSIPTPITPAVTCTNPLPGTPGGTPQTEEDYRLQVWQAGLAASQGMARYLKTLLAQIPGVQTRLVSVQQAPTGWKVICGGGDPYATANAIYQALFDISSLTQSQINVVNITTASPGTVTTDLNHGYSTGQVVNITGVVGMTGINGVPFTIIVTGPQTFTIADTTPDGTYVSGGVVTPNTRNIVVSIYDYPDQYVIPYVNPPQQTVTINLVWNTISTNFISNAAVAQLATPALVSYINSIAVGQPINLFDLQSVFQLSVAAVVPPALLTRMVFFVAINGVGTPPETGTGIIAGDPESFFFTTAPLITIQQG